MYTNVHPKNAASLHYLCTVIPQFTVHRTCCKMGMLGLLQWHFLQCATYGIAVVTANFIPRSQFLAFMCFILPQNSDIDKLDFNMLNISFTVSHGIWPFLFVFCDKSVLKRFKKHFAVSSALVFPKYVESIYIQHKRTLMKLMFYDFVLVIWCVWKKAS